MKILFTKAHCLCHDVNSVTKSSSHIDLIMGFSTGEIIWFEPMTQKYTRLNKNVNLVIRLGLVYNSNYDFPRVLSTQPLYQKFGGFQVQKIYFSQHIWTGLS
jgi:hypothetical protein